MSDAKPLSDADLAFNLEAADYGAQQAAASVARQLDAAYGKTTPGQIKVGILSSDAESGWVYCARHGHVHCVNFKTGEWAPDGICEHCRKEDWDSGRIQRRQSEVQTVIDRENAAVRAKADQFEAESRGQGDGTSPENTGAESSPGAVDESPHAPLQGNVEHESPVRVDGRFHVEQSGPDDRPAGRPEGGDSNLSGNWLHLVGLEDGLP